MFKNFCFYAQIKTVPINSLEFGFVYNVMPSFWQNELSILKKSLFCLFATFLHEIQLSTVTCPLAMLSFGHRNRIPWTVKHALQMCVVSWSNRIGCMATVFSSYLWIQKHSCRRMLFGNSIEILYNLLYMLLSKFMLYVSLSHAHCLFSKLNQYG